MQQAGIEVTLIAAGARKVDGNPYEALSDTARADMAESVNSVRSHFVNRVAENRNVSEDDLYETEAASFSAENSIPLLADEIGNTATALAWLRSQINADNLDGDVIPSQIDTGTGGGVSASRYTTGPTSSRSVSSLNSDRMMSAQECRALGLETTRGVIAATRTLPGCMAKVSTRSAGGRPTKTLTMTGVPYGPDARSHLGPGLHEFYEEGCFSGKGLTAKDPRVLVKSR
jgi:ClpP class serine protease